MLSQIFIVECELCYSLTPLKNLFYLQIHVTIDAFCYSFCNKFSPGNKKKNRVCGFFTCKLHRTVHLTMSMGHVDGVDKATNFPPKLLVSFINPLNKTTKF